MQPVSSSVSRSTYSNGYGTYSSKGRIQDNSTELTVAGGSGAIAGTALRNSSKIMKTIEKTRLLKGQKQSELLRALSKCGFAKYLKKPIVMKMTGGFAALSAGVAVIGSLGEISSTYKFLSSQNPNN